MAIKSKIEWTDHTWNPWHGCRKVSAGCAKCYMFRDKKRYGQDPSQVVRSKTTFDAPLKWLKSGKAQPGDKIFTCSWSDFMIEEADAWRDEALDIISRTPELIYQILTKRPERALEIEWPENVWFGVSVENQKAAEERIPLLWDIEARTKFVSFEPLLERLYLAVVPFNIAKYYDEDGGKYWDYELPFNWAIIGGESDDDPRPMNPEFAQEIVDVCQECEIPVFFKQMGGSRKIDGVWGGDKLNGKQYKEFPK